MSAEVWRDGWRALEARIRSQTPSQLARAGSPFSLGLREEMPPPPTGSSFGGGWGGSVPGEGQ